ncbi:hypothetical protein [Flavobacterium sp. LM4]|uniref:hypothetical protein n=1 Tax=Flavobacterium sp. LM4 TaxID=1938609 RepID=UPI001CB934AA|nr:hypothetical protein [Flavobacterium sp. LM4]
MDKGYHNGKQIEICKKANITTIVAQPEQGKNKERIAEGYLISKFQYDQTTDTYTCPEGERLKPQVTGTRKLIAIVMNSRDTEHPSAGSVRVKQLCTSRVAGRDIDRSQYADAVEENNKRYHANPQLYRKRSGNQRAYLWDYQTAMGL